MVNKRTVFIVMNLVTAVLSYAVSLPMIIAGEYLMALPVAALVASAVSLAVFAVLNRGWFGAGLLDAGLLRQMLAIGAPLMPSFLFYWVLNSASRLVIVSALSAAAAGVFAVAAKLGQVSQLIYTAFAQGWQYFAFSTMRDEDQVELNSRVFEGLGTLSLLATAALTAVLSPLYGLLFSEEYAGGAVCVPYLFLAPLLLMLYQVAANQLIVVRKTWPTLVMLAAGAATCFALQSALVPAIGIEGAAVGTLAGYAVTDAVAVAWLTRMGLLRVRRRFGALVAAFAAYLAAWRFLFMGSTLALCASFAVLVLVCGVLYRAELHSLVCRLRRKAKVV